MLDYAANGVVYWPAERLRGDFEARCAKEGEDAEEVFRASLGDDLEPDWFWGEVERNLLSGRIRLVFVSDLIPPELRRVIEFLNERMSPTEVVGVEIKQYVGRGRLTTLVPRVVGQTEQARTQKPGGSRSPFVEVDLDYYQRRLPPDRFALIRNLFDRIDEAVQERDLGWVPVLRSANSASNGPEVTRALGWRSDTRRRSSSGSSCRLHLTSCGVSATTSGPLPRTGVPVVRAQ